jgi:hypothetical protein
MADQMNDQADNRAMGDAGVNSRGLSEQENVAVESLMQIASGHMSGERESYENGVVSGNASEERASGDSRHVQNEVTSVKIGNERSDRQDDRLPDSMHAHDRDRMTEHGNALYSGSSVLRNDRNYHSDVRMNMNEGAENLNRVHDSQNARFDHNDRVGMTGYMYDQQGNERDDSTPVFPPTISERDVPPSLFGSGCDRIRDSRYPSTNADTRVQNEYCVDRWGRGAQNSDISLERTDHRRDRFAQGDYEAGEMSRFSEQSRRERSAVDYAADGNMFGNNVQYSRGDRPTSFQGEGRQRLGYENVIRPTRTSFSDRNLSTHREQSQDPIHRGRYQDLAPRIANSGRLAQEYDLESTGARPRVSSDNVRQNRSHTDARLPSSRAYYRADRDVESSRPKKPFVTPSQYNGNTPWLDYLVHFEMCSEINDWDGLTMARYLAVSLRGPAQQILTTLSEVDRRSYNALVNALTQRFNPSNQSELYRVQLRNRVRKGDETLPSLAQDIRRLASQAYPTAHPQLMDSLCRDHFLDALVEADIRMNVYRSRPQSLDEAVCIAVELEAFMVAERQRYPQKRPVRDVNLGASNESKQWDNLRSAMQHEFQCLKTELTTGRFNENQSYRNNDGRNGSGSNYNNTRPQGGVRDQFQSQGQERRCYNCDEQGHFIRDCPHPKRNRNDRKNSEN